MDTDLLERAKEIIETVRYINIATVSPEGFPWNTPVYVEHDEGLNFYWSSWINAEHSKNIRANKNIFITLYDSTRKRGDNHRRGLYMKAIAEELNKLEDIKKALKYFKGSDGRELKAADFVGGSVKRLYSAKPLSLWLNDISESQVTKDTTKMRIDIRTPEIKLEDL